MKKVLFFLLLLIEISFAYSQTGESLFAYNTTGRVISKSKFIDDFYLDYQNTPYSLFKSCSVSSRNGINYDVKLLNYNGTEGDGGYFRIIDIISDNKSLLRLAQSDGWDDVSKETANLASGYFIKVPLTNDATALIFIGHPYDSTPTLITIVVLDKKNATLVFNKNYVIKEFKQSGNSFSLLLDDQYVEYDSCGNLVPRDIATSKLWLENGILRFE